MSPGGINILGMDTGQPDTDADKQSNSLVVIPENSKNKPSIWNFNKAEI